LGVTVDSTLSFDQHVNNVCKAAHYHVRAFTSRQCRCVSVDDAKAVATALVSSRLDYCNSVLSGTSQSNLNKLQLVQNAVARTVMTTSKREHITPVLAELHWLPVAARIDFKIAVITSNLLTVQRPSYLRKLLQLRRPSRSLRSSNHNLLNIPRPRTAFVQRSFAHAAPPLVSVIHSFINH